LAYKITVTRGRSHERIDGKRRRLFDLLRVKALGLIIGGPFAEDFPLNESITFHHGRRLVAI